MIDKVLVKTRFSKSLECYNREAKIQKRMAERLVTYLSRKSYDRILEIGCGTGFLTELICKNIGYKSYVAVDIVEACSMYIEGISADIKFEPKDIESFLKTDFSKFDLIISNASLQWVDDFVAIIELLKSRLNDSGELIFSTFGKENFREIYYLSGTGLNYFSVNELACLFEKYSPIIEEEIHVMAFDTPKDVLKHLKATGVNALVSRAWTRKDLANFESGYRNICVVKPTLTYNPVYIKL